MKKALSSILAIAMIFVMIQIGIISASAYQSGDFSYELVGDNPVTARITGYTGNIGIVTIPSAVDGYSVTSIANQAFENNTVLTEVTVPDSVTHIGDNAFNGCSSLSVLNLGSGLYPDNDFMGELTGLININIAAGNPYLSSRNGVMYDKDGTTLVLYPKGRTGAFQIPSDVIGIDGAAFLNCVHITSVTIPNTVTAIGEGAFAYCTGLTTVTFEATSVVSSIDKSAFLGCTSLANITLPVSVTSIGDNAFTFCSALGTFAISASVTNIGNYAFTACSNLTAINVAPTNAYYADQDGVLFNKSGTSLLSYPEKKGITYDVPYGVTNISMAFTANSTLTNVNIPNSVTRLDILAFYHCTALTSIIIPDSVIYIEYWAFNGCTALTSVIIPASVTWIDNEAFYGCTNLTSVYFLGDAPTRMYNSVFANCAQGFTVYYASGKTGFTNPWYGYSAYPSMAPLSASPTAGSSSFTVTYPANTNTHEYKIGNGSWTAYTGSVSLSANDTVYARCKDALNSTLDIGTLVVGNIYRPQDYTYSVSNGSAAIISYSGTQNIVMIPDLLGGYPVTSVSAQVFENRTAITYITVPDSVTYLGDNTFNGCSNLKVGNLGSGLNPDNDFTGECVSLTYINVAAGNPYISSQNGIVFDKAGTTILLCPRGQTGMYTIPDGVTNINDGAFFQCSHLTWINMPNTVTNIGTSAFYGCTNITNIYLSDSLTAIGEGAFLGCSGLTNISIPNAVTTIGSKAFYGCTGLTSVNITYASSLTDIGASAFYNCRNIAYINVPSGVTSISTKAFYGCSGLTSIYFVPESNLTTIESSAFYSCTSLTNVFIPSSVTSIGSYAFNSCTALTLALFYGNAPSTFGTSVFTNSASGFVIGHFANATGWTNPWHGYATVTYS